MPRSSGASAASASAPAAAADPNPSDATANASAINSATPHAAISAPKERLYATESPALLTIAGATNVGNAPGGYSTAMSRYGTSPRTIASP